MLFSRNEDKSNVACQTYASTTPIRQTGIPASQMITDHLLTYYQTYTQMCYLSNKTLLPIKKDHSHQESPSLEIPAHFVNAEKLLGRYSQQSTSKAVIQS